MTLTWLMGLLRRRSGRLLGAATGVAAAVGLLTSLQMFLTASEATMTQRAASTVAVDWQVLPQRGADAAALLDATRSAPGVTAVLPVGFGHTAGLSAAGADGGHSTGPGYVLGLPSDYATTFPGQMRVLNGSATGVLLAQQTASNLHAVPGSDVLIARAGLDPVPVHVDGIVELPKADTLFHKPGSPATAPPDNVLLVPEALWHNVFDPLGVGRPDLAETQLHVARSHQLASDPDTAFVDITAAAHNLEAVTSGGVLVSNNLGAALDAARKDAAYARALFLFLGLPGAVLAALVTGATVAAGAGRRRAEQALLRTRGATSAQLLRLVVVEAAVIGLLGTALGAALALVASRTVFGAVHLDAVTAIVALVAGLGIATATVVLPARRDLRRSTVAAARAPVRRQLRPAWLRYGFDLVLLAAAVAVFSATTRVGYELVLAPEGVPSISVSYWAFAGPALLWCGAALLVWRLADLLLVRGRGLVRTAVRPLTGGLAGIAASTLSRQRGPLARSIVLLALTTAFAASTAMFNATYAQQSEVDARLTNGGDVAVTEPPAATVGPEFATRLAALPGVRAVEPVQHRFAYVGADLQDLYGVRPDTVTAATSLQDAYFSGGTAAELIGKLAAQPDALLVSAETVKDFALQPGDQVTLRLQSPSSTEPIPVPFRYAGVVKEFPTAPKDSFLVANADYVAKMTGNNAVGAFLLDTGGTDVAGVAATVRADLGPTAAVSDIASTRKVVGSSLTAVDLDGLTRLELAFALALSVAAGGLVLALGLAERRRSAAIATALGASTRQLRGVVLAEAAVLAVPGLAAGALLGLALSQLLVRVLAGVFDPPPAALAVPWSYLAALGLGTLVALIGAGVWAAQAARRPAVEVLRDL
jgi:putative ABC transport system permease protein